MSEKTVTNHIEGHMKMATVYRLDPWMIQEINHKKALRTVRAHERNEYLMSFALMVLFLFAFYLILIELTPDDANAQTADFLSVQIVHATVTAYTSSVDETDNTPFETAAGTHTRRGVIACPPRYSFGTHVQIEGLDYTCEDRMNAKYADRFDVWVPTKSEAYAFGKKSVEVAIRD